jgi:hypothetical protein
VINLKALKVVVFVGTTLVMSAFVYEPGGAALTDLPNRIPEAVPYITVEATAFPPPYEERWEGQDSPGQCQTCHQKIFDEWNGSMMSNSWRDPVWRAAFLLLARTTSACGECDTPGPPDGTPKASQNPFAKPGQCASEGSADPYAMQFKATASLGDGCPTLDLAYAAPLNLMTNRDGLPIDKAGRVIDAATNPRGLPQFRDLNGNGDLFDDAFLRDTRFKPMPFPEATKSFDRYSIVIPLGTQGPVAVSAAVYYQSVEAIVALEFLGNMSDTNGNFVLEPCVLGGLCDGRKPNTEPALVEGSPPVPMIVRNWVIPVAGSPETTRCRALPLIRQMAQTPSKTS